MSDKPATTVYGELVWRHMDAARKDFDSPRRAKLFDIIEAFRTEFPDECKVWEDRLSTPNLREP
jgi:hypothetical protein